MAKRPVREETGEAEQSSEVKRRVQALMVKVYDRLGGERPEGSPKWHADRLFGILVLLRDSNQLYQWPEEAESKGITPGGEITFAKSDQDGNIVAAEEPLTVPKYPVTLIEAFEAYLYGKPWEEVKKIMAHDPDISDKEIRIAFEANIDKVRLTKDVVALMRSMGPKIASKKVRDALVLRLSQKFERIIDADAAACQTFEELHKVRGDVVSAVESLKGTDMPTFGARDALDAAALELAKKLFDSAKTYRDVEAVATEVDNYPFGFEDFYTKPLKAKAEDVRTKIKFLYALRHTKELGKLEELRGVVEGHEFSDEQTTSAYRLELLDLVDKKIKKYRKE